METKVCKKCGETFPATNEFFAKAKECKDGFRGVNVKVAKQKLISNIVKHTKKLSLNTENNITKHIKSVLLIVQNNIMKHIKNMLLNIKNNIVS